jgi:glutamine synthetase
MREDGGFEVIKKAISNLSLRHKVHIEAYGEGNERRFDSKACDCQHQHILLGIASKFSILVLVKHSNQS